MDKLFLSILNMSLTGAFVIVAICLARLPLKKAPKIISYCLWAVAWLRLVLPFSIESVLSLIPFNAATIPSDIALQAMPHINSGIPLVNNAVSSLLPAATPAASVNPLQVWTILGAYIWLIGVGIMMSYGVVSYLLLKRKMKAAEKLEENIYESSDIKSPFVLGVFKPKIYLPVDLSGQEYEYIICHEQTHIRRQDHVIKFAAFFILCLHWFNPLAWVAFILMGVDMEMSCDENVINEIGVETKKDYSQSLLSMAVNGRFLSGSPLAFSEGGLKTRIKNILKYKKTPWIIGAVAVTLTVALSVGLMLNKTDDSEEISVANPAISDENHFGTVEGLLRSAYPFEGQVIHGTETEGVPVATRIRERVLEYENINDCHVIITEAEFSDHNEMVKEPTVSIFLTLESGEQLEVNQPEKIANTVRSIVPHISYQKISITDNNLIVYHFSHNSLNDDGLFTNVYATIEEASEVVTFNLKMPQAMLPKAKSDGVRVNVTRQTRGSVIESVLLDYRVALDSIHSTLGKYGELIIMQQSWGNASQTLSQFEALYNHASGIRGIHTHQTMVGNNRAVLWSPFVLDELLGLKIPSDEYVVNATLYWYIDGIAYRLVVELPITEINLDVMIAIAESLVTVAH